MWTRIAAPRIRAGSSRGRSRWSARIDVYSEPCVPATSASTGPGGGAVGDRHRDARPGVDAVRHLDPAGRQLAGCRGRASDGEGRGHRSLSFLGPVAEGLPRASREAAPSILPRLARRAPPRPGQIHGLDVGSRARRHWRPMLRPSAATGDAWSRSRASPPALAARTGLAPRAPPGLAVDARRALGACSSRVLVWAEIWKDELLDRAAALSYYFVFALFPTLLFLTTLLGMLPGRDLMERFLAAGAGPPPARRGLAAAADAHGGPAGRRGRPPVDRRGGGALGRLARHGVDHHDAQRRVRGDQPPPVVATAAGRRRC